MATLEVGFARQDITPPVGAWMAGYAARQEPCRGIHDTLSARAVALSDGHTRAVVLALDVCLLEVADADAFREAIGRAAGVGADCVLVNTSHTHAGPMTFRWSAGQFDEAYFAAAAARCARAAADALSDLAPARMRVGAAPVDIGGNRREATPDGRVVLGVNRDGARLAEATVWHLERAGRDDVILFSLPVHGTVCGPENLLISAEWMGEAVRRIERARPGCRAVFLQGCAGDQNPYCDADALATMAAHGQSVCDAVCCAMPHLREIDPLPVVNVSRPLALPAADGGTQTCPIHGLRLGEAAIVALGGEPFVEYALFGRTRSPAASTLVLGYTDGNLGYLPTEAAFAEGGYEPTAYQYWPDGKALSPDVEGVLKREIARMLNDLSQPRGKDRTR